MGLLSQMVRLVKLISVNRRTFIEIFQEKLERNEKLFIIINWSWNKNIITKNKMKIFIILDKRSWILLKWKFTLILELSCISKSVTIEFNITTDYDRLSLLTLLNKDIIDKKNKMW